MKLTIDVFMHRYPNASLWIGQNEDGSTVRFVHGRNWYLFETRHKGETITIFRKK